MMNKLILLGLFWIIIVPFVAAKSLDLDSLKQEVDKNLPDSVKINILIRLGWKYSDSNLELSMNYGKKAIYLCLKNSMNKRISEAYNLVGLSYYYKSEYNIALQYFKKAFHTSQQTQNNEIMSSSLSNIGLIYDIKGEYANAIMYHLKSLSIRESINDSSGISKSLNNIGLVYFKLGEKFYEKALEYYKQALKIKQFLNDQQGIAISLHNIGSVYYEKAKIENREFRKLNHFDTSLFYFEKALIIRSVIKDEKGRATTLMNIGNVYGEKHEYEKALANYIESLTIYESIKDKVGMLQANYNLGYVKAKQKKFEDSKKNHLLSLKIALEIDDKEWIMQNYKDLSGINKALNDYINAYEYLYKYMMLKDSIFNVRTGQQIAELQANYQNEANTKRILLLEKDNEIKQIKYRRNNLILGILAFSIITFMMVLLIKAKQKSKKEKVKSSF